MPAIIHTEDGDFIGPFESDDAAYEYIHEQEMEGRDPHVEELTEPD